MPGEHQLKRNTLLTTIPKLGKEWRLSFEIWPTKYHNGDATLIHLTTANKSSYERHGDRIPLIFFSKKKEVYVASSINEDPNYRKVITPLTAIKQWTKIEVSQQKDDLDLSYSMFIAIGGITLHSVKNAKPRDFYGVKVYASNPWDRAQAGSIRDLIIETVDTSELYSFTPQIYSTIF